MVGAVNHAHCIDMKKINGTFSIIPGYSQSLRPNNITQCLFGSSLQKCSESCSDSTIKMSGSTVDERGSCDWLADYFGLSPKFQSTIQFDPKVKTATIDFAAHIGLDKWISGLWFRVWAPFVHTQWDLNVYESSISKGDFGNGYIEGYFAGTTTDPYGAIPIDSLLNNALEFFIQGKTPNLGTGFTFEPLKSCTWGSGECSNKLTQHGLADLRFGLGWNFFQDDYAHDYHIGLGIMAAAPTGNRPDGTVLFEPMVGNGKHWELGIMWTSHIILWRSEDEDDHLGGYFDANITHLFKARQKRCFDLIGKPMSRYMLAQKMKTSVENLAGADKQALANNMTGQVGVVPTHQFNNRYAPVGNLTHSEVDVSIGAQADIVAMLNYTHGRLSFDIGYNLWARSCEKIELNCNCPPRISKELWALKGDANTYGFITQVIDNKLFPSEAIPLSATESNATIFKGSSESPNDDPTRNFGIDAPKFSQDSTDGTIAKSIIAGISIGEALGVQTKTSVNPILIHQEDINLSGSRTKGLSHSVFGHLSYSWSNNKNWTPFLGFGFQTEFASNSRDCNKCGPPSTTPSCSTSPNSSCECCESCTRCALSQWRVFIKGGVTFD